RRGWGGGQGLRTLCDTPHSPYSRAGIDPARLLRPVVRYLVALDVPPHLQATERDADPVHGDVWEVLAECVVELLGRSLRLQIGRCVGRGVQTPHDLRGHL